MHPAGELRRACVRAWTIESAIMMMATMVTVTAATPLWRVGHDNAHLSTARPLLVILVLCKRTPPIPWNGDRYFESPRTRVARRGLESNVNKNDPTVNSPRSHVNCCIVVRAKSLSYHATQRLEQINQKNDLETFTVSILFVQNNFTKNLLNAKSIELKSDLLEDNNRPTIKQLYRNFFRSDTSNFTKNAVCSTIERTSRLIERNFEPRGSYNVDTKTSKFIRPLQ